jgi:hypothetical protein
VVCPNLYCDPSVMVTGQATSGENLEVLFVACNNYAAKLCEDEEYI